MTPLERAVITQEEVQFTILAALEAYDRGDPTYMLCYPNMTREEAHAAIRETMLEETSLPIFLNDVYQVAVREFGNGCYHLSIKRRDRKPCRDWRDFQQIKNQLCGPECEGVELYPAESRVVDTANQYHLWVFKGIKFPFGFDSGRCVSETPVGKSVNRPIEKI